MNGLNFKDWEKISADKSTTTLRHKKGHVMTIAHSSLPRIQQEQLKRLKMADGGEVSSSDDVPEPNQKNAQDMQKGATESGWQPARWGKNLKEGLGLASNEAKGGMIKGVHQSDEDDGYSDAGTYARTAEKAEGPKKKLWKESALKEHKKVLGEIRDMKSQDREYLAEGGEAETPSPEPTENQDQPDPSTTQAPPATNITINAAPAPASPMMMQPLPQQASPLAQAPKYEGNSNAIPVPEVPKAPGSGFQGVANESQQAVGQQQAVDVQAAAERAKLEDTYLKQKQAQIDQQQQDIQQARAATQRLDAYAQTHPINPNSIYENMSAPAKVSTAIGLLLGGLGGGLNHTGQNPAMNYLMDQQAKDIQAQKDRMEQQKTVYGAYHQLYGDDVIATNLATISYNDMLKHQIDSTAAKLGTAQAAANAAKAGAAINVENVKNLGKVGLRLGELRSGQVQPTGPINSQTQEPQASQSSAKKIEKEKSKNDTASNYVMEPLLSDEARATYQSLGLTPNVIMTAEQKNDFSTQYNKAYQTDIARQSLPRIMNQLYENATPTGKFSRIAPNILTGPVGEYLGPAVGAITGAIGQGGALAADKIYGHGDYPEGQYQTNKRYEDLKNQFTDLLANAMKGNPNITPSQVRDWADQYAPDIDDTPKTILDKIKKVDEISRQNSNIGTLEAFGGSKRSKNR